MRAWAVAVLDLLFPALCPVCRAVLGDGRRDPLCGPCWSAIERIDPPLCTTCGRPLPTFANTTNDPHADRNSLLLESRSAPGSPGRDERAGGMGGPSRPPICNGCAADAPGFDYARAAGVYAGSLRDALHALKYRGKRALARPLADLVLAQCATALAADVAALVPVPLARARVAGRGFNQAELIAERIAAARRIPLRRRWLVRTRETQAQAELTAAERRSNVRDAFAASAAVGGLHVVLVDDILTTGATAAECARALRAAGAARVGVLTVARAL